VQAEAVVLGTAEVSHLFENDVFGVGEWGRARALLFAAAQRFATIKAAFSERMRERYAVGAADFRYHKDDLTSFFIWVNASDKDRQRGVEFWRERFRHNPAEAGRFLGWVNTILYQGDPLEAIENLFPVNELFDLVADMNSAGLLERERKSVDWFRALVFRKRREGEGQNPEIEPPPDDGED
jgi:hypothetical protein